MTTPVVKSLVARQASSDRRVEIEPAIRREEDVLRRDPDIVRGYPLYTQSRTRIEALAGLGRRDAAGRRDRIPNREVPRFALVLIADGITSDDPHAAERG